jgi:hypothetical protein
LERILLAPFLLFASGEHSAHGDLVGRTGAAAAATTAEARPRPWSLVWSAVERHVVVVFVLLPPLMVIAAGAVVTVNPIIVVIIIIDVIIVIVVIVDDFLVLLAGDRRVRRRRRPRVRVGAVAVEVPDDAERGAAVGADVGRGAAVDVGDVALEGGAGGKVGGAQRAGEGLEAQVDGALVRHQVRLLAEAARAPRRRALVRPQVQVRRLVPLCGWRLFRARQREWKGGGSVSAAVVL